jgi:hypothetical protein
MAVQSPVALPLSGVRGYTHRVLNSMELQLQIATFLRRIGAMHTPFAPEMPGLVSENCIYPATTHG